MADKCQRSGDGITGLRRKKSFQGRQYRRRTKPISEQYKADLSRVLGLTVKNNCAFACNEATGNLVYPAGCVIVIYQVRKNKEFHIFNPGHKSLTCIQISLDGQYIVTGESGHLPCVRVFSVAEKCQMASFQSHKFGISCVAFSPNSQYIVSIGYQHDNVINVWNWRKNVLASSNKVSIKVRAVAFSEDNSRFVTVGNRHVKFWYIERSKVPDTETVPLKGRSGLLGGVRNQLFCDVACGVGSENTYTYVLSRAAMLCQFNDKRTLANSLQLQATTAFCLSVVSGMIVCGCGDGKVLLHSSSDLQLLSSFVSPEQDAGLCNIVAVSMDGNNMWIHCIHNDHTMRVWDLLDFEHPVVHSSCSFHSDCVWDIKGLPPSETENSAFYTCSNDATVKLWDLKNDTCEMRNNISVETGNAVLTPSNPKGGKIGIRSLCVSRDANFLAVGDRNGVIHIFRTEAGEHQKIKQVEMHSGDILSLSLDSSVDMLASASRDRCIYILDSNHRPTYTIDDHSAAVTAVEFVHLNNKLRLISCGVDKSLYFCTVNNVDGRVEIVRDQHIVEKHAMHDMTIVRDSVLVACGANLREYDIDSGKSQRCLRGCESLATIVRVATDMENTIIAISCADKYVHLLGYLSGECLLELRGHSEICTALTFASTNSETTLVTASADSCIFTWKLTRYAKVEDGSLPFQSQLSPHAENEQESEIDTLSKDPTMTLYFGDPALNGTLFGDMPEVNDSPACEQNGRDEPKLGPESGDLDVSLPTWLTGNKDKVIKVKKPTGKWASRFQDVIILDTPRTVMEWDHANSSDSDPEDEMEDSEDEEEKNPVLENGTTKLQTKEEKNDALTTDTNSFEDCTDAEVVQIQRGRKEVDETNHTSQVDTSATLSTDYASALDEIESKEESKSQSEMSNSTAKKFKSEVAISVNNHSVKTSSAPDFDDNQPKAENINLKIADNCHDPPDVRTENFSNTEAVECDSATAKQTNDNQNNIPPAFANFLENLTKKKPRAVPGSLPVRSSYNLRGSSARTRSASDTANFMLSSSANLAIERTTSTPNQPEKDVATSSDAGASSSDECQEAVENLMTAYEHAESIYHRVSGENLDAQTLLSNTFSSLKDRIDQLQLKMVREHPDIKLDLDNYPSLLSLLRDYSDKLCCMVTEEIQKKSVIKE